MPFSATWMNLDPIIQSEVSQKEKNKYHILRHMHGLQKDGTDESICRAVAAKTQTLRTDLWTRLWEQEVEGGMYGVGNMETYINICKIYSQ